VPSDKRRRKKEGRQVRLAAARAAARRKQRQRRLLTAVIAAAAIFAVLAFLARGAGDDDDAADTTTTTTSTSVPVTVPEGRTKPDIEVPDGAAPTELVSTDLIPGAGPTVEPGDEVTIHYVGVLHEDGSEFDSSWDSDPVTFDLDGLIEGWQEGIPGMQVGGRRQLVIPPDLGYADQERPGIPAGSTLVFVIDLLAVG
jgi:peptidylprolyl isomerase